jgi:nucleoside-diphosphate-sugar epimerase
VPNGRTQPRQASQYMKHESFIIAPSDRILVTGAAGFIGSRVVESLLGLGFQDLVCLVRPSSDERRLDRIMKHKPASAKVEVVKGNLLSPDDCEAACKDVAVVFHLAAGTGEKSFPDAFMNTVVATRNLLNASIHCARLRRLVLVSSFAVYTNRQRSRRLDESCPTEEHPELHGDAYCYAKVRQEQIVCEYGRTFRVPYVVVRPGTVYGGGDHQITGRVGLGTFGFFLHLGGSNTIPFTHVENCAKAVALAGLVPGVDNQVFNIVDDDLPSSRWFLSQYKQNVTSFKSVYVPHPVSHALCYLWEKYSLWSQGQLPPVFNRRRWNAEWRKTTYSNEKLKAGLGWTPKVSTAEGMKSYLESCAEGRQHA